MSLKIGMQLYSVREALRADPVATLEQVVAAGYHYLEAANGDAYADPGIGLGMPADRARALLERLGATLIGAHVQPFDRTNWRAVIDYHKTLGSRTIVVPIRFFHDQQDLADACREMNEMGKICAAEGMTYLYHNHYHEFRRVDGTRILDHIAARCDPRYVNFEIDTFWALRAGLDPVAVLKHYGSRVKAVHLKDFSHPGDQVGPANILAQVGEEGFMGAEAFGGVLSPADFTEIGTGRMDIQAIIDATIALGTVEHIILEQDHTRLDPLQSIRVSRAGFARYRGVDGGV